MRPRISEADAANELSVRLLKLEGAPELSEVEEPPASSDEEEEPEAAAASWAATAAAPQDHACVTYRRAV